MCAYERAQYARGFASVAGVDEAGRGSLAGPVVAAAVTLPRLDDLGSLPQFLSEIRDSKQLSSQVRSAIRDCLRKEPSVGIGIGIVDEAVIDRVNILQATHRAMRLALAGLPARPDAVLVDGMPVPDLGAQQVAIVGGDARSLSIAAASIVAKVARDEIMVGYDGQFPSYGFAIHKGYGTKLHLDRLRMHGPCAIHRNSFEPVRQMVFAWDQ